MEKISHRSRSTTAAHAAEPAGPLNPTPDAAGLPNSEGGCQFSHAIPRRLLLRCNWTTASFISAISFSMRSRRRRSGNSQSSVPIAILVRTSQSRITVPNRSRYSKTDPVTVAIYSAETLFNPRSCCISLMDLIANGNATMPPKTRAISRIIRAATLPNIRCTHRNSSTIANPNSTPSF